MPNGLRYWRWGACLDELDSQEEYTAKGRRIGRTLALVRPQGSRGASWSPITLIHQLVALQATPIRKLGIPQVIGSALEKMVGANGVVFRTWARRLFVVNLMA